MSNSIEQIHDVFRTEQQKASAELAANLRSKSLSIHRFAQAAYAGYIQAIEKKRDKALRIAKSAQKKRRLAAEMEELEDEPARSPKQVVKSVRAFAHLDTYRPAPGHTDVRSSSQPAFDTAAFVEQTVAQLEGRAPKALIPGPSQAHLDRQLTANFVVDVYKEMEQARANAMRSRSIDHGR